MMPAEPQRRDVLVIAYYFPPMGLSGVQRTLKFVKYLPQFGWQPTVVTVTPTGYFAEDTTLLDEIREHNIEVIRIGSLDFNRLFRKKGVVQLPSEPVRKFLTFASDLFFIPDNKIGWKRKVLHAIDGVLKTHFFNIIFATAPPFTDFLIGKELHDRTGLPLVIDYRDVWHEYPFKYYPTPLHRYLNTRLEKSVLRSSAGIITTNRRVKELILTRYPFLHYNDVTILPQGFDPEDFSEGTFSTVPRVSGTMRIAHAGTFYGDRSLVPFLRAIKQATEKQPALRTRLEVHLIGAFRESDRKRIAAHNLDGVVHVRGYIDHRQCVRELLASDILWLTLGNDRQSPGKVYEYLGTGKPILACVPDGFIKQTILEAGAGIAVRPDDVDGLAAALIDLFDRFQHGTLPQAREEIIQRYNRVNLTGELAKIFGFLSEH